MINNFTVLSDEKIAELCDGVRMSRVGQLRDLIEAEQLHTLQQVVEILEGIIRINKFPDRDAALIDLIDELKALVAKV